MKSLTDSLFCPPFEFPLYYNQNFKFDREWNCATGILYTIYVKIYGLVNWTIYFHTEIWMAWKWNTIKFCYIILSEQSTVCYLICMLIWQNWNKLLQYFTSKINRFINRFHYASVFSNTYVPCNRFRILFTKWFGKQKTSYYSRWFDYKNPFCSNIFLNIISIYYMYNRTSNITNGWLDKNERKKKKRLSEKRFKLEIAGGQNSIEKRVLS